MSFYASKSHRSPVKALRLLRSRCHMCAMAHCLAGLSWSHRVWKDHTALVLDHWQTSVEWLLPKFPTLLQTVKGCFLSSWPLQIGVSHFGLPSVEVSARVALQLARLGSLLHLISSCVPLPLSLMLTRTPCLSHVPPESLNLWPLPLFLLVLLVVVLLPLSHSPSLPLSLSLPAALSLSLRGFLSCWSLDI